MSFFSQTALLSTDVFDFGCPRRCLSLSLADLIHKYSSRFVVRRGTSPLGDLWRNVCPPFISAPPPSFALFVFHPLRPATSSWVCTMINKAVFSDSIRVSVYTSSHLHLFSSPCCCPWSWMISLISLPLHLY